LSIDRAEEETSWAEARDLIECHGDDLPKVYAAACLKLAEVADWDGIGRWVDLIHRCEHLRNASPVIPFVPVRAGSIDEANISSG